MTERFDCSDPEQRAAGLKAAGQAVRRGDLVVLPTDTVYGIGADAFTPEAVAGLLAAKGRGRDMPPPVLVGSVSAATALIEDLEDIGRHMIEEFWPGGLTLVCRASRTLNWDLGDTMGTVAIRMPMHPLALDLLRETGPLAVTSANVTGSPAAVNADEAQEQLGGSIAVILDGGPATGGVPSTIVDVNGQMPRLLRAGAISVERLAAVALVASEPAPRPAQDAPASAADGSSTGSATGSATATVNGHEPPPEEPR
jgi:L-threonylcarbamoyladenylate synthase